VIRFALASAFASSLLLLPDAGGEAGEIAIGGHEAEAVEAAGVQQAMSEAFSPGILGNSATGRWRKRRGIGPGLTRVPEKSP
jgi:hypothetical protein